MEDIAQFLHDVEWIYDFHVTKVCIWTHVYFSYCISNKIWYSLKCNPRISISYLKAFFLNLFWMKKIFNIKENIWYLFQSMVLAITSLYYIREPLLNKAKILAYCFSLTLMKPQVTEEEMWHSDHSFQIFTKDIFSQMPEDWKASLVNLPLHILNGIPQGKAQVSIFLGYKRKCDFSEFS